MGRTGIVTTLAVLALCAAPPALAQSFAGGDGSQTDNPALLLRPGTVVPPGMAHAAIAPAPTPLLPEADWRVTLRGTYQTGTSGERFEAAIVPQVSFSRQTLRGTIGAEASAELVADDAGAVRIDALRGSVAATHALDAATTLSGTLSAALTDPDPTDPLTTLRTQRTNFSAEGAVTRDLGPVDLTLRGTAGHTAFADPAQADATELGAGLRVGLPVGPRVSLFADGEASRLQFADGAREGDAYALRGGVAAALGPQLSAEASLGVGLRRYDDGSPDLTTALYDGRLVYAPGASVTLTAALATEFGAAAAGDPAAAVTHTATASASYGVNPWLTLRSSAFWQGTQDQAGAALDTAYGAGLGADYLVNAHTALSADYELDRALAAGGGESERHRVSLGVTLRR